MKNVTCWTLACLSVIPNAAFGQYRPIALPYQLTHSVNMDPSFAPDGKRIVYISVVSGKEQLFIAQVDGSAPVQVTRDDADHEDPAWSPDGRKIAYVLLQHGLSIIQTMDIDGSNQHAVTPPTIHVIHPHWSLDSGRIVYCTTDDLDPPKKNASEIQEIDLRTSKIRTLISGGINTYPAFSPDGRKLALRRFVGTTNSEVFVADDDGSHLRNITNNDAFDGWPAWSPDGTQIAFASNRRSNYQIFVMNADGSNVRLLANTDGRATAPAWSPDGRSVLFPVCRNVDFGVGCEIFVARIEPMPH
jgi:TolB protein